MAYATGKFAWGECDRCGFHYRLRRLHKEWTNLLVCDTCWDYEPEQVSPIIYQADAEALREPRPERDRIVSDGITRSDVDPIGRIFKGQCNNATIGTVEVMT